MQKENYRSKKNSHIILTIIKYLSLLLAVIVVVAPVLVILFAAFKTRSEFNVSGKLAMPNSFLYFDNFKTAFTDGGMITGLKNTVIIMAISLAGTIIFGAMVAYVLDRFDFIGKKLVFGAYLVAMLIPMVTTQVATFKIINALGLFGTIWAPIVLYLGADVMSLYIMLLFMESIHVSLDESAKLEGASYAYIFFRIILPNLKPAIATVAIIRGVTIYNDFYIPFLYMPDQSLQTLSTSLYKFMGPYGGQWNVICAGVILIIIPTLVAFLSLQKYIYNGFVNGSVK
ncbi:carbohydrate ABC transporter permease [Clostridium sp.]|uniref:carbohydrate ABC transporter permease n=1 Tax=Clostridium sp. TaxID=1506 RepID=UPI00263894DA|nr:carbohydrate ABC transporter permease [uncultured Clostridium sp.]